MIGVHASPARTHAVEEFFQLFKTPWEPFRSGREYDAVIDAGVDPLPPSASRVVLAFRSSASAPSDSSPHRRPASGWVTPDPRLGMDAPRLPLFGPWSDVSECGTSLATAGTPPRPVLAVTRNETRLSLRFGYALFDEVHHLLEIGQTSAEAAVPTLDLHVDLLRRVLLEAGVPLVEIPPMPWGHPFSVALTHDVDHPLLRRHRCNHTTAGFLGRALLAGPLDALRGRLSFARVWQNLVAAARLPLVHARLAGDFWADFDQRYLALERPLGATYFVLPRAGHPGRALDGPRTAPAKRASSYGAPDIAAQLARLREAGCEIGLHGIDAWADAEAGRLEKEAVGVMPVHGEKGVRMHWLYFGSDSPARLEEAGFTYDSTVGYNETVGYRAGTAQVYRPEGSRKLLELPLHAMDTALFYPSYLHLTDREAQEHVEPLIERAENAGGVVTFNWHDRSLAPERLWGEAYAALIARLRQARPWFAPAGGIVAWFRGRRAASFDGTFRAPPGEDSPGATTGPGLPAYRLRTYTPSGGLLGAGPGQRRTTWRETEYWPQRGTIRRSRTQSSE